jgi:type VI secretion system protein ImpE
MQAEELLQAGQIEEALADLEKQVRADPANAKLRVFLFQLLAVMGDWKRSMTQLNVAGELDAANMLMVQVSRAAIQCEAFRTDVFSGKRLPLFFGEPDQWMGLLVQANQLVAEGKYIASQAVRERALELAPATAGSIDGQAFEWISDLDSRLGPVVEAIIDGKYYWVPFTSFKKIQFEEPADLRDLVWLPVHFTWTNDGESFGLIPTRYPDSDTHQDSGLRLARKTEWLAHPGDVYLGLGQRMFSTDEDEFSLLQIRQMELNHPSADPNDGDVNNG